LTRLNIPHLLDELNAAGLPDSEIAARLGARRSTVSLWHAGDKRPGIDFGWPLLCLHFDFCRPSSPLTTIFALKQRRNALTPEPTEDS